MTVNCRGERLILTKERAIYWKRESMLIVSDIHIGKSAYFRKSGIPVPDTIGHTDLHRLALLIEEFRPLTLVVTGDMFHNKINSDVNALMEWRKHYSSLKIILVKGNHDELKSEDYQSLDIEVYNKELLLAPFRFMHDKPKVFDEYYNITGHIHPGVVLHGKAKQRLKFPCFYFGKSCAVLPAFSVFTGLSIIPPEAGDLFYAITPSKVIKVNA